MSAPPKRNLAYTFDFSLFSQSWIYCKFLAPPVYGPSEEWLRAKQATFEFPSAFVGLTAAMRWSKRSRFLMRVFSSRDGTYGGELTSDVQHLCPLLSSI